MSIDYAVVVAGQIAPGKFYCRTQRKATISLEQMAQNVALRSDVPVEVCTAVLSAWDAEALDQLKQGNAVAIGHFGDLWISLKDTLDSADGGFNPVTGRASLDLIAERGWDQRIKNEFSLNKVAAQEVEPQISNLKDVATDANNNATRNNIVRVEGSRLKFDKLDATQGVFFQPTIGVAVRATVYESVGDNLVVLLVPGSLAAGAHTLLVKAKYTAAGNLRTGTYNTPVTVI